ncbi:tRNA (adenosine(37)-N6)-threonylcarbamoyltransferase complex ATPase subunit type 1 TsaE [Allomuricauda sp. SCSIO 65647]|uniref:tRNA (adenosine(37)-N6)-threonylcarbamoyltransferase complex ATPase subunit type 1 TsaE n=1 Tax=Allomuricauda sp. SCSIO 65647 TaxID=2908843 RepID=UPI001F018AD6|nr:tRNA (adenosine(37)-N6)-threonylcarbamoyltransferase complex ATPase subunit type 1 TsaE [Muricauda sp. SCSIO 65647]UJH67224.1 tRNA (adenosine(37)-N6)-threonylcarbamoyltransferase complex ATPase subunit type 1 TsaE [Muricauda sp. SCSIO 65647]
MRKIIYKLGEIHHVADKIVAEPLHKIVCLYGPMGIGKTTLIKAMVKTLGGVDNANSPTFGLVNEYHNSSGDVLAYHFDFYRINDMEEVLDIGFEDYLASGTWVFIEWPEKIEPILPDERTRIFVHFIDEITRGIEF